MTNQVLNAELRIRTDAPQMNDVITQIGKEFEMTSIGGEALPHECLFTIRTRKSPETLPQISVIMFEFGDIRPVTPAKLRSAFCNPVYAGLEPYSQSLVDDELWIATAAMLTRREGVEQFLVNMLYTLQSSLGVEGEERRTHDVPPADSIPPYPENDIGIEHPVSLRVTADKAILKQITRQLGLVFVLSEQKNTGKSGVKHFSARLSQVDRNLPRLSARYMPPQQIFAHPPGFTDEFLQVATDPNVMWNLFANPMYTGVADFPRFVSDERWLHAAALLMRDAGIEQFLVNMLYLMRRSSREQQSTGE